jgi:hypothetical protein
VQRRGQLQPEAARADVFDLTEHHAARRVDGSQVRLRVVPLVCAAVLNRPVVPDRLATGALHSVDHPFDLSNWVISMLNIDSTRAN